MSRTRLVMAVLSALLLVGVIFSWTRSYLALDMATYGFGTLRAPGEDAADPDKWTYTNRTVSVNHRRGQAVFFVTHYRSVGRTRDDMKGWLERKHWDAVSVPISMVRPSGPERWWRFTAADDWSFLGLGISHAMSKGETMDSVSLPHWMLTAAFAGLLVRAIRGSRAHRRRIRGLCPACGYDLKGATSPGCPECGAGRPPHPATAVAA